MEDGEEIESGLRDLCLVTLSHDYMMIEVALDQPKKCRFRSAIRREHYSRTDGHYFHRR